jgi:outer membrane protein OmpA-like peptidoglycan-associated protein
MAPPPRKLPHPNFIIHVLDSNNNPIKANLYVDGVLHGRAVKADTTDFSCVVRKLQTVKIRAAAIGHMPYQATYSTTADTATVTFYVRLVPIRSGEKITLKDIQFMENSASILPSSRPSLEYILQFLLSNPKVNILIKGYTNDPHHKQSKKIDLQLSEQRTNAVLTYLTSHHISKGRIQCIGYGSVNMLYPKPKNPDQEAANRRVEIEIQ